MHRITVAAGALAVVALAACTPNSSDPSTAGSAPAQTAAASTPVPSTPAAPASLVGTWKQTNGTEDAWQEAEIQDGVIEVYWISNQGDTRSLFWSGTYEAPKDAKGYTWTSQGDVEKMRGSLLGSQDATKDFTFENNSLSWKASMMGTTATIRASRQK